VYQSTGIEQGCLFKSSRKTLLISIILCVAILLRQKTLAFSQFQRKKEIRWKIQIIWNTVAPTMAVPKKRTTRARRDLRRYSSAYRLHAAHTISCKNCNAPVLPHRICGDCGFYNGKQVVAAKSAEL
jgi:large subunit ribosomal protein L32